MLPSYAWRLSLLRPTRSLRIGVRFGNDAFHTPHDVGVRFAGPTARDQSDDDVHMHGIPNPHRHRTSC